MHTKNNIVKKIKEHGGRITPTRKSIAKYVSKCKGLFCAQDVLNAMPKIDSVSTYRTIDLFVNLDILFPVVQIDGHQYYELHSHKNDHNHIICTGCKKTDCVKSETKPSCTPIAGYTNVHRTVAMTGLCNQCQ